MVLVQPLVGLVPDIAQVPSGRHERGHGRLAKQHLASCRELVSGALERLQRLFLLDLSNPRGILALYGGAIRVFSGLLLLGHHVLGDLDNAELAYRVVFAAPDGGVAVAGIVEGSSPLPAVAHQEMIPREEVARVLVLGFPGRPDVGL